MYHSSASERVASWLLRPSAGPKDDAPLTVDRLLTLVRPADYIISPERPCKSWPWKLHCWGPLPITAGYLFNVSLVINRNGGVSGFAMPMWICGASLEFVHDRFSDPEWRCQMRMEPRAAEIDPVVADEVDAAYRARAKGRAELYGSPKHEVVPDALADVAIISLIDEATGYQKTPCT